MKVILLRVKNESEIRQGQKIYLDSSFVTLSINAGENELVSKNKSSDDYFIGIGKVFVESLYSSPPDFAGNCTIWSGDANEKKKQWLQGVTPDGMSWTFAVPHEMLEQCIKLFADTMRERSFSNSGMKKSVEKLEKRFKERNDRNFATAVIWLSINPESTWETFEEGSPESMYTVAANGSKVIDFKGLSGVLEGFYDKFFSTDIMSLTVQSNHNFSYLESLVRKNFDDFKNRNISYMINNPEKYMDKEIQDSIKLNPQNPATKNKKIFVYQTQKKT